MRDGEGGEILRTKVGTADVCVCGGGGEDDLRCKWDYNIDPKATTFRSIRRAIIGHETLRKVGTGGVGGREE